MDKGDLMALSYINNKEIKFGSSKPLNGVYTPGSPTREYEPLDSLGIYLNSGIPLSYGVENGRYMSMSDEFAATSQGNSYSFNQFFAAQMMLGFKLHDRFIACDTEHKIIGTEPLLHKAYLAEITEKTLDYFKIKIYEEKTRTFCIRMSSSEVPTSYVDLTNSFDENGLNLTQTDRQSFLSYYRFYPLTARDPSSRFEETLGVDYYLLPSAEGLKELSGDILSKFNAFISSDGSTLTNLGNTAFAYAGDINYVPNYRGETSEAAVSAAESARVILGQVEEIHAGINQILPEMKENLELTKQYRDEAMSTEIGTVREDLNQLNNDLDDFYGTGKNIYNNNTDNKRVGIYMTTLHGNVQADASYGTVSFPIDATKGSISVNKAYTFIHFFDKEIDVNDLVVGSDTLGYISGVIAQSSPLANITIPTNAKCVVISTGINKFNTLQVEYGSEITSYEPYVKGINGNKIVDKTIPLSKLEEIPSQDYDNSIYELPFINNKRLCCNKVNDGGTACYIGVDTKGIPNKIVSKFIMEEGTSSGTVALILQKNGLNKVSDITNGSFHCVITATGVAVNILKDNGYLTNPIDINLTHPLLMDGVTENTVTIEVSGNDITITINNGTYTDTYNGTFAYETYNLSDFIGRYAQIEHYCSGDRNNKSMPMFTYWEVSGTNIFVNPKDNFSRPNGLLDRTPNGYEYHVFTNANNGY